MLVSPNLRPCLTSADDAPSPHLPSNVHHVVPFTYISVETLFNLIMSYLVAKVVRVYSTMNILFDRCSTLFGLCYATPCASGCSNDIQVQHATCYFVLAKSCCNYDCHCQLPQHASPALQVPQSNTSHLPIHHRTPHSL